jgi:hypothetical protein
MITLVFVHGTGVRKQGYDDTLAVIREQVAHRARVRKFSALEPQAMAILTPRLKPWDCPTAYEEPGVANRITIARLYGLMLRLVIR